MITRMFGIATATIFTMAVVIGIATIIASDFGDVKLGFNWAQQTFFSAKSETSFIGKNHPLRNADNITFFKSVQIKGTKLKVTTGIAFASPDDVLKGKTKSRWCYIMHHDGKLEKRISLGRQDGQSKPRYSDLTQLPKSELKALGLSTERLAAIARSHCYLSGFDPRTALKQQNHKQPSPRVWNWKQPYSIFKHKKKKRDI